MPEKWIKLRLFTSTWNIWRRNIPLMKNYDKDLDAVIEEEEFMPPEEPWYPAVRIVGGPHGFMASDGYRWEMVAVIPEDAKESLLEVWKRIKDEPMTALDIANALLDVVYEYDDEPAVETRDTGEEVEVVINANYLPSED